MKIPQTPSNNSQIQDEVNRLDVDTTIHNLDGTNSIQSQLASNVRSFAADKKTIKASPKVLSEIPNGFRVQQRILPERIIQ